jgi:hypothetical protein
VSRLRLLGTPGRALAAILVVVLGLASGLVLAAPAGAASPPPNPTVNAGINISPTTGLVDGQPITYTVTTSSPATLFKVQAHICRNLSTFNSTNFGFDATDCVEGGAHLASGQLASGDYEKTNNYGSGETTTGPLTFHAGTTTASPGGQVQWVNDLGTPSTLACTAAAACALVVQVDLQGDSANPPTSWFVQPLTYLGPPTAPLAAGPNQASGTVTFNWTAPSDLGNGTLANYQTATDAGFTSNVTTTTSTSRTFTGLTDFVTQDLYVRARSLSSDGTTTSAYGPAVHLQATPSPAPVVNLTGAPGNNQVTLTFTPPAGTTPDHYRVAVTPTPTSSGGGGGNCDTGSCSIAGSGAAITGLHNGTTYQFQIFAVYSSGASPEGGGSNVATQTPAGSLVYQVINVDRPQGVLVISQQCAGFPQDILGNFDPSSQYGTQDGSIPNPTWCTVDLSGPRTERLVTDALTSQARTVHDATLAAGSTTVTSPTIGFTNSDVNQLVTGTGIPGGTRIVTVTDATHVVLSNPAAGDVDPADFSILGTTVTFSATPHPITQGDRIAGPNIGGGTTIVSPTSPNASFFDMSMPAVKTSDTQPTFTGTSYTGPAGTSVNSTIREFVGPRTPAHLITTGPKAGQYLEATGAINELTVVDYRDVGTAWTATGAVSQFCDGSGAATPVNGNAGLTPAPNPSIIPNVPGPRACQVGDKHFSGDDLGITPRVKRFSAPITSPDGTYTMLVDQGSPVLPGTVGGLGGLGVPLANAHNAGSRLGMALIDGDLDLMIPVIDQSGHYQATFTFTVV